MLGSASSIADINTTINTAIAEALCEFSDELEASGDIDTAVLTLIKRTIKNHERILFNGNNYSDEWVKEAKERGLSNLKTSADALPALTDKKNIELFKKHGVFTENELISRRDIKLDMYSKTIKIEASCMNEMVNRDILPAIIKYKSFLAESLLNLKNSGLDISASPEKAILADLHKSSQKLMRISKKLDTVINKYSVNFGEHAAFYANTVLPVMNDLRKAADEAEVIMPRELWPFPNYSEILYSVK